MISDLMLLFDELFFFCDFFRQSVDFSLQCAWLLEAYSPASLQGLTKKNRSHGIKLKNLIMSGKKEMNKKHILLTYFLSSPNLVTYSDMNIM